MIIRGCIYCVNCKMICSWGSASQQVVIRGCIYYVNCKMICSLGTTSQQMVIRGCKHVSCKMICSWRDCTMGPSITAAEMHPAAPHALFRQISSPIRRIPSPDPTGRAALLGHKTQLSTPVIRPERDRGRHREREEGGGRETNEEDGRYCGRSEASPVNPPCPVKRAEGLARGQTAKESAPAISTRK